MSEVRYFSWSMPEPPLLLRRVLDTGPPESLVDEMFTAAGVWQPTGQVEDWQVGENWFVDQITEAEARVLAPAAFA